MQWSILIANEASTGLYFTQTHNKNSVLRKFQTQKQAEKNIEKAKIVVEQMSKTRTELAQIIELNRRWMKNMDESVTVFENRVDQILAAKHLKKEADSKDEVELSEKTDKT